MDFVYRGKKYSWDEWNKEYNEFIDSLELPDDLRIDIGIREFSLLHDIGYGIAIDKFLELYSMIASARSALINAFEKFYDSNIISWNSGYKGQLWMRFQYLKNAIIWYNSCEDYIYQIIWFAYDLYPRTINSEENYLFNLKKCCYDRIIKKLDEVQNPTEDVKVLKMELENYRNDPDVYKLREELANNIKHRANIQVQGLEDLRMMGVVTKDKDGKDAFNSDWIKPKLIDIDDTVELLRRVHIKLLRYARFILNFMNIDNMFIVDENGYGIINQIRKKADYKKILTSQ